ncbi:Serine/Threonine kinase domain protein (macronuclear) [Tetrahymena thermophila SB210]|uniref:Serine/Threonine kinase domain protein n=1 Tax=Tetrahymena thermophila (strain SB210) TaxID=312017 RepID=Q234R1_TETTS|nr:Serine/Threonine kinase domain protein [Tetrahymena thermophila SB210]EAR91942.2 Serine/Threonine kinase domain protein [Tetrahymena thermophila SB210]|eukprot:XP_001012187.2 Serine/Threonine kinase domain protein [Tetrahymena thermophila SB210]
MDLYLTEIGNYKIESYLGRGAYGVVYKCVHNETNQVVAIKTLRKITKTSQKLLKSEIEVLQKIDCVNVVKMIESFSGNLPYDKQQYQFLVMEYCESNLLDYVYHKKNHILEEKEAVDLFLQILNGFQSIHEKGIIHRDLKLENVLIQDGIIKIADFGLAKKLDNSPTSTKEHLARSFCGTKAYLAPEVLMGNYYDYKVDIWSLGVLLFVMLFFQFPFGSRQDNPSELLKAIKQCCEDHPFDVDLFIKTRSKARMCKVSLEEDIKNQLQKELQLQQNIQQKTDEQAFQISEQMKDLFKRIFVVNPEERIGFQELIQHPALNKHKTEDINQKVQFYENKFPTLFKYQSQQVINGNTSQENRSENQQQEDEEENKNNEEITTGQMSSIMMVRNSTIRMKMKNSSQFRTHIMIYNLLICRYQVLVIAYQQVQQGWIIDLLGQKEYTVLKYFLLKIAIYYLQNLKFYLDETDNIFDLKDWANFVNCKAFKNMKTQILQDIKKWTPEYHLLSQEVQDYSYDSEDIKRGVYEEIPQKVDAEIYINSLPNEIKLPFRAVTLTIFTKVYGFAAKCFSNINELGQQVQQIKETILQKQLSPNLSPQSVQRKQYNSPSRNKSHQFFNSMMQNQAQSKNCSNFTAKQQQSMSRNNSQKNMINMSSATTQTLNQSTNTSSINQNLNSSINSLDNKYLSQKQQQNIKNLYSKISFEEQFGLKSIRMALLLLCCGVINRIFEVPSCIIRLKQFQPQETSYNAQNQQETFKFEELIEWFYQVSKEGAYKQIELLVNSYFKQISSQLLTQNQIINQDSPKLVNELQNLKFENKTQISPQTIQPSKQIKPS